MPSYAAYSLFSRAWLTSILLFTSLQLMIIEDAPNNSKNSVNGSVRDNEEQ